ncbi:MAG TPA: hypothetical protein VHI93_02450 [Candidatus Thermoplasmatota archaeon]|nr:hypothetical protein [Candidatus Thermoplasmatota archaeon]
MPAADAHGEDAGEADGWSIHVPTTGFATAEVENEAEPDPLLPSARQLRVVIRDTESRATGDP